MREMRTIDYYLFANTAFEETNYSRGLVIISDRGNFVLSKRKTNDKTIYALSGILDSKNKSLAAEVSFVRKEGIFEKEIYRIDTNRYWFLTDQLTEEEKCGRGS